PVGILRHALLRSYWMPPQPFETAPLHSKRVSLSGAGEAVNKEEGDGAVVCPMKKPLVLFIGLTGPDLKDRAGEVSQPEGASSQLLPARFPITLFRLAQN